MDKRNIKSKGYDSMDLLEEEDHSADEEMDDKPIPGVELGKKCQKGDIVSKVFSRSRFVITDRQQGMDGRVSYTLRSITYVEGSKDPDRVQPAGDPFQIDDDDSTYHLSPFCVRQGRIEPIDRDDEEVDEEMSAEEPLSGKKGEKEKVQISIPKSGPSASPAAAPTVALLLDGQLQQLSSSQDNSLIWACYCANTLPMLADLRSALMKQRRASDIDGWITLGKDLAKKDFADVAILITLGKNTTYSYETHIIAIKNTKSQYDLLHQVVFEFCNATHRTHWEQLDAAAKAGNIGCIAYAYAKEALELLTEQQHDDALSSIVEAGKAIGKGRDRDARRNWPVKTPLELTKYYCNPDNSTALERLKMQIASKHTEGYIGQWIGDYLSSYINKNPAAKAAYRRWLTGGQAVDEASEVTRLGIPGLTANARELQLVATEVAKFGEYILKSIATIK